MNIVMSDTLAHWSSRELDPGRHHKQHMCWGDFVRAVDFFVDSRCTEVNLRERTYQSHPLLPDFLSYLSSRRLRARVFTDGCLSDELVHRLRQNTDEREVSFVVDLNPSDRPDAQVKKQQMAVIEALGQRCTVAFTLRNSELDYSRIVELFSYGIVQPKLLVNLAHPQPDRSESYLHLTAYPDIFRQLFAMLRELYAMGVEIAFNCGFPLCLFSDEELGALMRMTKPGRTGFTCRPSLDIGPELDARSCPPLTEVGSAPIEHFPDAIHLETHQEKHFLRRINRPYFGVFKECQLCQHRRYGRCSGGCRGYAFTSEPLSNVNLLPKNRIC